MADDLTAQEALLRNSVGDFSSVTLLSKANKYVRQVLATYLYYQYFARRTS